MKTRYVFLLMLFFHHRLPLDGILSLHEAQEQLCGLEDVTRASIEIRASGKWVKSQVWVNRPFNYRR